MTENEFEAKLYALSPKNRKIIFDLIGSLPAQKSQHQQFCDPAAKEQRNEHRITL